MINRNLPTLTLGALLIGTLGCTPGPNPPEGLGQNAPMPTRPPDFVVAAKKLGITEGALTKALGLPDKPKSANDRPSTPPRMDIKGAAKNLGVTEEKLITALGIPVPPAQGDRPAPPSP